MHFKAWLDLIVWGNLFQQVEDQSWGISPTQVLVSLLTVDITCNGHFLEEVKDFSHEPLRLREVYCIYATKTLMLSVYLCFSNREFRTEFCRPKIVGSRFLKNLFKYFFKLWPKWNCTWPTKPGPDPIKKISCVKLRSACLEHFDWLEIFDQPIRKLKPSVA